jgi:uncharacterized membrane protein
MSEIRAADRELRAKRRAYDLNRVAAAGARRPSARLIRFLWTITAVLILIGAVMVVRRALNLLAPSTPSARFPEAAAMDAAFARYRSLTMIHIVPGLLFLVLAPFQFVRTLRNHRPRLHRWMGRVTVASGLITGVSALLLSSRTAIGGANERAATRLFALLFLFSLSKAFVSIRSGDVTLHREWMIRAFAIGLAVATVRPIVGVFFATRSLTQLTPHEFFGIAFWLGFTIHLIAAEVWIDYTRPRATEPIARRESLS